MKEIDRKSKQELFEKNYRSKFESIPDDININRELIIYTRSNNRLNKNEHVFNAENINLKDNIFDLKLYTGFDNEIKEIILNSNRFIGFINKMINKIEKEDLHNIDITCKLGRHRSVAIANIIKDKYYRNAQVIHLELNKIY